MKKALAIILMLALVFSFSACDGKNTTSNGGASGGGNTNQTDTSGGTGNTDNTGNSGSAGTSKPYPNCNEDGSINLDRIAHYDQEYDYTQNPKFKIAYIAQAGSALYQQSAAAYEHWAPLFNCEWAGFISANGDSDMFLTNLQNLIDQGVKGFILDPDSTIFPAVVNLLSQYPDVQWMAQMSAARDGETGDGVAVGGNLIHPYVGFDNYDAGKQVTKKLIEWKEETYPDVPWNEIGFLAFNYSVSPQLNERVLGSQDVWKETTGSLDNFFVADCVSTGIDLQGGIDAAGPIISSHSEYKYWLVNGLIDDFAQAAASILDTQGLTETSCVIDFGGSALQMQWDEGQQDAYRYALFTAQNLYAEPIIGAVYAMLNGWATPQTLWPSWVKWDDHGKEGETYAQLRLPTVWLEPDTYKHYLEWTDMYAHADAYPYSQEGISLDDYSPFVDKVPDEYKAP